MYFYVTIPGLNKVSIFEVSSNEKIIDIGGFHYPSPIAFVESDKEGPNVYGVFAEPVQISNMVTVTATVDETDTGGLSIATATYSLEGGPPVEMQATDESYDEITEDVWVEFTAPSTPGIYEICVMGTDSSGNEGIPTCTFLAVYDPEGGFVTGGGWIDSPEGAYIPDPTLTGKGNFGFVSKYKKGATVPIGQTEFQFHVADLNFHSDTYDWLVVTGNDFAKFKGTGTINGAGEYKFQIWAGDTDPDIFRIKIWEEDEFENETVIYDNGFEQEIGGGSIVIHAKKK